MNNPGIDTKGEHRHSDSVESPRRVALVTGASTGIGRGIAEALAVRDHCVAMVSRSPEEAAKQLSEAGHCVTALPFDLATADPSLAVQHAVERWGRIDVLVHAAASTLRKPAMEISLGEWRAFQQLNVDAAFGLACAAAADMRRRQWGRILFITSIMAVRGGYKIPLSAYATAKAGLTGLTRALANEWGRDGIRVNCLAPGFTRTSRTVPLENDVDFFQGTLDRIPVGRWAEVSDMIGPAMLLCSPESDYMTGQTLFVDGGWLIH